ESDTKDLTAFFSANRWLFADLRDLEQADRELDLEIAEQTGLVEDLDASRGESGRPRIEVLADLEKRWKDATARFDDARSGYFETPDGTSAALRIVTTTSGTGDGGGDALLARVERDVRGLEPRRYDARMVVGYAGDIPNAVEEKRSLMSDAFLATVTV